MWTMMDNAIIYAHCRAGDATERELMLNYQVARMKLFGYQKPLGLLYVYKDIAKDQPELRRLISLVEQNKLRGVKYMLIDNWESISPIIGNVIDVVDLFYEKGIDIRPITDWRLDSKLSWLYRFKTGNKAEVSALKKKGITWVKVQW